jgi:hypothetical protein
MPFQLTGMKVFAHPHNAPFLPNLPVAKLQPFSAWKHIFGLFRCSYAIWLICKPPFIAKILFLT